MPTNAAAVTDRPRTATDARQRSTKYKRQWPLLVKVGLIGSGVVLALGALSIALLFYADYDMAGISSREPATRAAWAWEFGDHTHYAVHLVLGRIYDVCPCTRNAAGAQYYYANFHAVTPLQRAVLANSKPTTPSELAGYISGPFLVWLEWAGDGMAWLGGQRPVQHVIVRLDPSVELPDEIHIARGTTVTWRNVDSLGDAHTITSGPNQSATFDSDWLPTGEEFHFTFRQRTVRVLLPRTRRRRSGPVRDGRLDRRRLARAHLADAASRKAVTRA